MFGHMARWLRMTRQVVIASVFLMAFQVSLVFAGTIIRLTQTKQTYTKLSDVTNRKYLLIESVFISYTDGMNGEQGGASHLCNSF